MDIPAILDVIRSGAQWSKASTQAELASSWTDGTQVVPTQDELDYAWENVDSKFVLTTNATDTAVPHNGIPDILGDGVASCTLTITKKKSDDTVLTTPTLLGASISLSAAANLGTNVVVSLASAPSTYNVGEKALVKEGATQEVVTINAVGANDVTVDLVNNYTAAATIQRCVEHTDTVYVKTTGGKLSAENVTLVSGTVNLTLTSENATKIVTITAYDGGGNGVKEGTIDIQFHA